MTIKEMKALIEGYDDDAEFMIAISDHAEIKTFYDFGQDEEYEEQALCLTVHMDHCVFSYDSGEEIMYEMNEQS